MVSFHIVPVIVYLIIRVISYTFRFKRGAESSICIEVLEYLWPNKQYPTPVLEGIEYAN